MEKRGGKVAGEGCPNTTSQRAEMEKEKARGRGEGSPGRRTAPPLQKCDLPLGAEDAVGTPGSAACSPQMEVSGKKSKNTGSLSSVFYSF